MRIGLDLDNTITCYNGLFLKTARDLSLIPDSFADNNNKNSIRNYLRKIGKEDEWTRLQGYIYGPGMNKAVPFPGVLDFLAFCKKQSIPVFIISHRTKHPYLGPKYDLHGTAREWISSHGLLDPCVTNLTEQNIFLESEKEAKIARIATTQCSIFMDDLLEFLIDPRFPSGIDRVLFSPGDSVDIPSELRVVKSWSLFLNYVASINTGKQT